MKLSDFDAVTFDFYGTIVDWEPEILAFLRQWTEPTLGRLPGSEILEVYDRLRQPIQEVRPAWRYSEACVEHLSVAKRRLEPASIEGAEAITPARLS